MPKGRIQPRTWFVKFGLAVSGVPALEHSEREQPPADLSAAEIQRFLRAVVDKSIQDGRHIRSLRQVSFGYKSADQGNAPPDLAGDHCLGRFYIVDVV